jgi:predicted acyl esterase
MIPRFFIACLLIVVCFVTPNTNAERFMLSMAVRLKLYVSSSAIDIDSTAKLLDIYPDGRQMLITDTSSA